VKSRATEGWCRCGGGEEKINLRSLLEGGNRSQGHRTRREFEEGRRELSKMGYDSGRVVTA
jgi:hypothetical protein